MNDNEVHYLSYDPDEIWTESAKAYIAAGGDVLYPGDEKEMFLRGMMSVVVQAFAGVDNALRMATLRYAVRDYLDLYGEARGCSRIEAAAARAKAEITFRETGEARTIAAGTPLAAPGGEVLYLLEEDVSQSGYAQTVTAGVVCAKTGGTGNGLLKDMVLQFLAPQNAVVQVVCTVSASGGQDREEDAVYKERIRTYGLNNSTTGSQAQYESAARKVSSEILDARAVNEGAGVVGVYLLLAGETGEEAVVESVAEALNAENVRPLTDTVQVSLAPEMPYVLRVQYMQQAGSNIAQAVEEAKEEYRQWQDETIGRAFNPDKLMAMLYQAGAVRVAWGEGSHFANGNVAYTEIPAYAHCKGDIELAVMT